MHTAEIRNDAEAEAILRLKPDRIGHGTFISPSLIESPHLLRLLKESNIPVGMKNNSLKSIPRNLEGYLINVGFRTMLDFQYSVQNCVQLSRSQ